MATQRRRPARDGRALQLWEEVYRLHAALGMAMDALGDELGKRPSSSTPLQLGELSRRELEVLSLLREAHSAPDIARQLRVSVHTVRNHVRSIYRKLGVSSRAALMRRLM